MTDELELRFMMHGCREIMATYSDAAFYQRQVSTLERAVKEDPSLAFDLAKSLVETTCKTILTDLGVVILPDWTKNVEKLFNETVAKMKFVPDDHPEKERTILGMQNVLKGLTTAVLGLAQIRNNEGVASHGKDAYRPTLTSFEATMAARAADTIVHFMFSVHLNYRQELKTVRLTYPQNSDFNDYVDEIHGGPINIFDGEYRPSEVLFEMDQEAYRVNLTDYLSQQEALENDDSGEEAAE
jgi:hypothetical protein